ncbi:unnamed protein product [Sphagnum tenellum]
MMLSTAEYLTLLQKMSSNTTTMTHMQHITASSHEQAIQEDKEFDVGAASPPSPLPCVAELGTFVIRCIEPKTLKYWIRNSKQKFKRELSSEEGAMQGGH